ncbi:hypothetical protein RZS28_11895 [Methylocapsa polymorpha]|uniref:Transposase n=1 Tax=Methylocapsa polymorpha TaxID=3080828 RepID=A0ABZ0HNK1_9HYPH|nr:hypothetical protein RZS28_11895 [Methylocapsa sp. RX1]
MRLCCTTAQQETPTAARSAGRSSFLLSRARGDLLKVIWHDGQGACLFRSDNELYRIAPGSENVGASYIVGGSPNQIRVEPDPERLSRHVAVIQYNILYWCDQGEDPTNWIRHASVLLSSRAASGELT